MSLRILIDMNLSPEWEILLCSYGYDAIHWSLVGDPRAVDEVIMDYARQHGYIVFTHDLDFGAILAVTRADGPSVLQVRTQNIFPDYLGTLIITALSQYEQQLTEGALISIDERAKRVRMLPIR